jgi:hypothetical protein
MQVPQEAILFNTESIKSAPVAIEQGYVQSAKSKIQEARFNSASKAPQIESGSKEVTKEEIIKLGDLNRDASSLVEQKLRSQGRNPDGSPMTSQQRTTEAKPRNTQEAKVFTREPLRAGFQEIGKYAQGRRVGNDLEFTIDSRLPPADKEKVRNNIKSKFAEKFPNITIREIN